jgi:hypothetical protein
MRDVTQPAPTVVEGRDIPSSRRGPDVDDRSHPAFLWTVVGLVTAALWIRPIGSSLWTDELGTWWVISGTARQVVQRAEAVQGQSPLYYLIAWVTTHVTGRSELGLRLPSLLFCAVAALLIYRIARRLIDVETARIAVITFAVWPSIAFAASDARPYALATLAAVASAWALVVWLDSPRVWKATCYVVLAAIVPYVHPVFGLVLIPEMIYALARIRERSTSLKLRDVSIVVIGIAALTIPVALELVALWRRHDDWLIPNGLTVSGLVQMLVPPAVVAATVIGGLVVAPKLRIGPDSQRLPRSTLIFVFGWFLIPAAVLIVLGILTPIRLVTARYLLCAAPGGALLAALVIRIFEPPQVRRIIIMVVVILSVLDLASPVKSGDMRGAVALARSVADEHTIVLINAGFEESLQPDWYTDPERVGLLTAATSFYPVPGMVVPLPVRLDLTTLDFVRTQVGESIAGSNDVIVISDSGSAYGPWFEEFMGHRGWTGRHVGDVNLFTVTEFTRTS